MNYPGLVKNHNEDNISENLYFPAACSDYSSSHDVLENLLPSKLEEKLVLYSSGMSVQHPLKVLRVFRKDGAEDNSSEAPYPSKSLMLSRSPLNMVGSSDSKTLLASPSLSMNADAYIMNETLIGVADGVSSIELEGYDARILPEELLNRCRVNSCLRNQKISQFNKKMKAIYANCGLKYNQDDFIKHILSSSCAECNSLGSTTCVLVIIENNVLHCVNVGDSRMLLLRRNKNYIHESNNIYNNKSNANNSSSYNKASNVLSSSFSFSGSSSSSSFSGSSSSLSFSPSSLSTNCCFSSSSLFCCPSSSSSFCCSLLYSHFHNFFFSSSMSSFLFYPGTSRTFDDLKKSSCFSFLKQLFLSEKTKNNLYEIVCRSLPQQHSFNCPYQLTRMPDVDCTYRAVLRRADFSCELYRHSVQEGDIVILGTDGVFDNLFDEEILNIVNSLCSNEEKSDSKESSEVECNELHALHKAADSSLIIDHEKNQDYVGSILSSYRKHNFGNAHDSSLRYNSLNVKEDDNKQKNDFPFSLHASYNKNKAQETFYKDFLPEKRQGKKHKKKTARNKQTKLPRVHPNTIVQAIISRALNAANPVSASSLIITEEGKNKKLLSPSHVSSCNPVFLSPCSIPFLNCNANRKGKTPFSEALYFNFGKISDGGKPDDTTVIVAYIVCESNKGKLLEEMNFKKETNNLSDSCKVNDCHFSNFNFYNKTKNSFCLKDEHAFFASSSLICPPKYFPEHSVTRSSHFFFPSSSLSSSFSSSPSFVFSSPSPSLCVGASATLDLNENLQETKIYEKKSNKTNHRASPTKKFANTNKEEETIITGVKNSKVQQKETNYDQDVSFSSFFPSPVLVSSFCTSSFAETITKAKKYETKQKKIDGGFNNLSNSNDNESYMRGCSASNLVHRCKRLPSVSQTILLNTLKQNRQEDSENNQEERKIKFLNNAENNDSFLRNQASDRTKILWDQNCYFINNNQEIADDIATAKLVGEFTHNNDVRICNYTYNNNINYNKNNNGNENNINECNNNNDNDNNNNINKRKEENNEEDIPDTLKNALEIIRNM